MVKNYVVYKKKGKRKYLIQSFSNKNIAKKFAYHESQEEGEKYVILKRKIKQVC